MQAAFITTALLHELKDFLIDIDIFKWTDVLETVYKLLCKCHENDDVHFISYITIVVIGFMVPLISFALIIIPLLISLTTYR